jgi:hypothetical protein
MKITNTNEAAALNGTECYINAVQDRNTGRKNQEIKALMVPVVIVNSEAKNGGYLFQVRQYETGSEHPDAIFGVGPFGGAALYSSGSLWKKDTEGFLMADGRTTHENGRYIPLIDNITDQGSITIHYGPDSLPIFTRIYSELLAPSEMGPVVQDKNGRFSQSALPRDNKAALAQGQARKKAAKASKAS